MQLAIQEYQNNSLFIRAIFREPKLIFVTSGVWKGSLGGIEGADAKCNSDSQCKSGKHCKALLASAAAGHTTRRPWDNWVLSPSTVYINTDGKVITRTDSSAKLVFLFTNPIYGEHSGWTSWTGMNSDGSASANQTCGGSGFTLNEDASYSTAKYGNVARLDMTAVSFHIGECTPDSDKWCSGQCSKRHLYCAEQ